MSYSNDFTQIRNGFVNYIGSALNASPFQDNAARHHVVSMMIEEAINLATDEDKSINLYAIKPLFRGCKAIFEQRRNALKQLPTSTAINEQIAEYDETIKMLDNLINNIQN